MELKVKAVPGPGEKSVQEVEETLLEQHEETTTDVVEGQPVEQVTTDEEVVSEAEDLIKEFGEEDVLSYIKSKYFNELKETYKVPVESTGIPVNDEELESYNAYKEYISQSQDVQEVNKKRSEYFQKKTEDLFNDEFKGFEFNIGDQKIKFSPGDTAEVKNVQSDVNNFISKYLDDEGVIKDATGYHKSLSAAMNPDKLAEFFYEKGKSDAVGDVSRQSKNINMDVRSTPQQLSNQEGLKIRAVEADSGRGLKIKKR